MVFESDMFEILQGDVGPPALRPEARVFYDGIRELGWRVTRIAPGHGRLVEWSELVDALSGSE